MKTKLAISLVVPVLIMLGSTGCVTSTSSYTRDIVYRDGSYYSPADEQYGDYYYEPEPDTAALRSRRLLPGQGRADRLAGLY